MKILTIFVSVRFSLVAAYVPLNCRDACDARKYFTDENGFKITKSFIENRDFTNISYPSLTFKIPPNFQGQFLTDKNSEYTTFQHSIEMSEFNTYMTNLRDPVDYTCRLFYVFDMTPIASCYNFCIEITVVLTFFMFIFYMVMAMYRVRHDIKIQKLPRISNYSHSEVHSQKKLPVDHEFMHLPELINSYENNMAFLQDLPKRRHAVVTCEPHGTTKSKNFLNRTQSWRCSIQFLRGIVGSYSDDGIKC